MLGDQALGAQCRGQLAAADEPGTTQAARFHLRYHRTRRVSASVGENPVRLARVGPLGKLQGGLVSGIAVILRAALEGLEPLDAAIRRDDQSVEAGGDV